MSKHTPTYSQFSEGADQTIGIAQMMVMAKQFHETCAQLDQRIDAHKQKLADLRKLKRKTDRFAVNMNRKIEDAKAILEAEYGHCFDLRDKEIPWEEMTKWLADNGSGETVTLPYLVAIRDPHTAFWFKVRWL